MSIAHAPRKNYSKPLEGRHGVARAWPCRPAGACEYFRMCGDYRPAAPLELVAERPECSKRGAVSSGGGICSGSRAGLTRSRSVDKYGPRLPGRRLISGL